MGKMKKKFNKLNSVEAYDCLCWTALASCTCMVSCYCNNTTPSYASNRNAGGVSIFQNESAYNTYQAQNRTTG